MTIGKTIINTRFLLFSILLSIAASASATGQSESVLQEVMSKFSEVKISRANFKESKTYAFLSKPLLSEGRLSYVAPDHIQKETLKPHHEFFEIKGGTLLISKADGKNNEMHLQNYPAIQAFAEAYRGVLSGDLKKLKRFYEIKFSGEFRQWVIVLIPRSGEVREYIEQLVFEGRGGTIIKMITVETGGDSTEMKIIQAK